MDRRQRMAIKIKCSNNEIFRVSPVYCLLEPGGSQRLQVIVRDPGEAKTDKIVLLYRYTTLSNPRDAFTDMEKDEGTHKKIIALVAREDVDLTLAPTTNLKSILKAYPQC
ncbi:hypothetical protein OSTOST_01001 [Ostertagia ostertagi]